MFIVNVVNRCKCSTRRSLGYAINLDNRAPRHNQVEHGVNVVCLAVGALDHEYVISLKPKVLDHHLNHWLAMNVNQRLGEGVTRPFKTTPSASHRNQYV